MLSFRHSLSNMLSNIFNLPKALDGWYHSQNPIPTSRSRSYTPLKFHSVHGGAIKLFEGSTVAKRDERYFEHSIVFSNCPIGINDVIAVEVMETTTEFHGPMRVGFSSINPSSLQGVVPLGRDFKGMPGVWIKSIHLCPASRGAVIYFKVNANGTILYGMNGQTIGSLLRGVNLTHPLWAVVEAYGSVQTVKFTNKTMNLHLDPQSEEMENVPNMSVNHQRTPRRSRRRSVLIRNVQLPTLTIQKSNFGLPSVECPPSTPFFSPGPFDSPGNLGFCIICSEKERNAAFLKCGHVCMCQECAIAFKNKPIPVAGSSRRGKQICPVCRTPITDILRIYC